MIVEQRVITAPPLPVLRQHQHHPRDQASQVAQTPARPQPLHPTVRSQTSLSIPPSSPVVPKARLPHRWGSPSKSSALSTPQATISPRLLSLASSYALSCVRR